MRNDAPGRTIWIIRWVAMLPVAFFVWMLVFVGAGDPLASLPLALSQAVRSLVASVLYVKVGYLICPIKRRGWTALLSVLLVIAILATTVIMARQPQTQMTTEMVIIMAGSLIGCIIACLLPSRKHGLRPTTGDRLRLPGNRYRPPTHWR